MTVNPDIASPVQLRAESRPGLPEVTPQLVDLYEGFEKALLVPLWTQVGELMPLSPQTKAQPHLWRWQTLLELAGRAGELVPVGRGGERRAIALANPSLGGKPYASPTLWAAIQYLMPGEDAPEHRHTQNAFRFVVEGALDGKPLFRDQPARERALDIFSHLRIWDTVHNNGVLIYLLLADRGVEIVADRGIDTLVGSAGWEKICRAMEADFKAGNFEAGVIRGIGAVSLQLAAHFPKRRPGRNELPDAPVVM